MANFTVPSYRTARRRFIYTPTNGRIYDLLFEKQTGHRHIYLSGNEPHTIPYALVNWPMYNIKYLPLGIDLNNGLGKKLHKYPVLAYDLIHILTFRAPPTGPVFFVPGSRLFDILCLNTPTPTSSTPTFDQFMWLHVDHPFLSWEPVNQRWRISLSVTHEEISNPTPVYRYHQRNGKRPHARSLGPVAHTLNTSFSALQLVQALIAIKDFRSQTCKIPYSRDPYAPHLDHTPYLPRRTCRIPQYLSTSEETPLQALHYVAYEQFMSSKTARERKRLTEDLIMDRLPEVPEPTAANLNDNSSHIPDIDLSDLV